LGKESCEIVGGDPVGIPSSFMSGPDLVVTPPDFPKALIAGQIPCAMAAKKIAMNVYSACHLPPRW